MLNFGNLSLTDCLIIGNETSSGGGGIYNTGMLAATSCLIISNSSPNSGGGVYNSGTLSLVNCVLTSNWCYGEFGNGGGAIDSDGKLELTGCALYDNRAPDTRGGAILGAFAMTNSTLSGNVGYVGGACAGGGYIVSCTISGNSAVRFAGGISDPVVIMNTIVAGNRLGPDASDVSANVTSSGYNLIGTTNGSSGWVASDLTGSTSFPLLALLGPLQDNGGPTPTMAPLDGSAAIDNGKSFGLTSDQRGLPRPVDLGGYDNVADGSDIGACEVQLDLPVITIQPTNQTVVQGQAATFYVSASGILPLSHQWRLNEASIPGATASSYAISSAQPANAGTYTVVVTNVVGSVTSSPATLTVLLPPTIVTQPTNVTVLEHQPATFSVTATGTEPLSYQWLRHGEPLSGATNASYTITSVWAIDADPYSVVVTNAAGSVTSSVATLTVLVPAQITSNPQSQTVDVGADVFMSCDVRGTQPIYYQWTFNGTNLTGATSYRLFLYNVQLPDSGSYALVATNLYGSDTSWPARLTVNPAPFVIAQWNFNSPVPDANLTTGTLNPSVGSGSASYTGGTAPGGSTGFGPGSTNDPAASDNSSWVTTGYAPQAVPPGFGYNKIAGVRFTASTVGRQNIRIKWDQRVDPTASKYWRLQYTTGGGWYTDVPLTSIMFNANTFESKQFSLSALSGVDNNPLFGIQIVAEWESTAIGSGNQYYVPAGAPPASYATTGISRFEMVTISGAPVSSPAIITDPVSQSVLQGQDATFSVSAEGFQPLSYQWCFNGTNLPGATATNYTVVNAQPAHEGDYSVVVTNGAGSATSAVATLTVLVPPGHRHPAHQPNRPRRPRRHFQLSSPPAPSR